MSVDDAPGAPSVPFGLADIYVVPASIGGVDEEADNALEVIGSVIDSVASLINNTVLADGVWITSAAAAPTDFLTPLYYDSTAVSGGLYAWDGDSYVQIGGLIA